MDSARHSFHDACAVLSLYPAFYYVGEFATPRPAVNQAGSINLLLVMNGIGLPGRLLPDYNADRLTGPMNLLVPCTADGALLLYCWIEVRNVPGMYVFSAIYSIFGAMM